MSDYGDFQWGVVGYPLAAGTGNTLLKDADPAIFEALAFFESVLRIHLGARWDEAIAASGRPDLVGKIVASRASYDVIPLFQEAQFALPCLALYRMKGTYGQRTVQRSHEDGIWGLDWILPPLKPSQMAQLAPFLRGAATVISDRTDYGFDPANQSGREVWKAAGLEYVSIDGSEYTWMVNRGPGSQTGIVNTPFPVLHLNISAREQRALHGDPLAVVPNLFPAMTSAGVTVSSVTESDPTGVVIVDATVPTT